MTKKTYRINGMHCPSCALVIESDLEEAGITARCNYVRSTLDVAFDETKIPESKITETVRSSGYILSID